MNCNNNAIITWSVACKFDFYLSSAVNERAAANVNSLGSQLCNRGFYSRLLLSYGIAFFTPALDKERAAGIWECIILFSSWQVSPKHSPLFVWFARRCVRMAVKSVHTSRSFCAWNKFQIQLQQLNCIAALVFWKIDSCWSQVAIARVPFQSFLNLRKVASRRLAFSLCCWKAKLIFVNKTKSRREQNLLAN